MASQPLTCEMHGSGRCVVVCAVPCLAFSSSYTAVFSVFLQDYLLFKPRLCSLLHNASMSPRGRGSARGVSQGGSGRAAERVRITGQQVPYVIIPHSTYISNSSREKKSYRTTY